MWPPAFEVRGRLRLDQTTVEERSVLQRDGLDVKVLWRERGDRRHPRPGRRQPLSADATGRHLDSHVPYNQTVP